MKILIVAQPRSGTKFLQSNLMSYLKKSNKILSIQNYGFGVDEILNVRHFWFKHQKIDRIEKNEIILSPSSTPNEDFLSRIELLVNTEYSWVTKFFPFNDNNDSLVINSLLPTVDRVYIIDRDRNDLALSRFLARKLDIWTVNERLLPAIEKYTKSPIEVNQTELLEIKTLIEYFYEKIVPQIITICDEKTIMLNFNDLIKINSSVDLLNYLKLPMCDFEFVPSHPEFYNHKYNMIKIMPP